LFETRSGSDLDPSEWQLVQPQIAKVTRVCSHDRAGSGWSEPGPEPRTSTQIANELKQVAAKASASQQTLLMTRCDHTFELFSGEYIQCSRPTGHDGDHHFEVPPLDAALKK